jgi:hypothetical protein
MATWHLLTNDEARETWDAALLKLDDYSPFQSYAWGEYRRSLGWEPCRWAAYDEAESVVAMISGVLRRYPLKFGLVWSEGGPIGDLTHCNEDLHNAIKRTTHLQHVYCRFRCDRERQTIDALRLNAQGWNRSWFNLTSNFSMCLDLAGDEAKILSATNRNFKRNLAKSAQNITTRQWIEPDIDEMLSVYTSMQEVKGLEDIQTRDELQHLLNACGRDLVMFRSDDESGNIVSLTACLVFGNRASVVLSATSKRGRELCASYSTFWAMLRRCQEMKLESCDLAGIDPISNPGVYRFKRDTGAKHLEYLGEWDWATSPSFAWLGNWGISQRSVFSHSVVRVLRTFVRSASSLGRRCLEAPRSIRDKFKVAVGQGAIGTEYLTGVINSLTEEGHALGSALLVFGL